MQGTRWKGTSCSTEASFCLSSLPATALAVSTTNDPHDASYGSVSRVLANASTMNATACWPLPPCTVPTAASVAIIAVCGSLPAAADSLAACAEIVPGPLVNEAIIDC